MESEPAGLEVHLLSLARSARLSARAKKDLRRSRGGRGGGANAHLYGGAIPASDRAVAGAGRVSRRAKTGGERAGTERMRPPCDDDVGNISVANLEGPDAPFDYAPRIKSGGRAQDEAFFL